MGCGDSLSCPRVPHLHFPHPLLFTICFSLPRHRCSLSPRHVVHLVLFGSSLDLSVNLLFPLSHTMDFFLFFSSAKRDSFCQQNMFFISWKMPPTKTHMADNDYSEQLMSLTTADKKVIECYKGGTMNKFRFRIAVKCPDSEHKLAHKTALN